MKKEMIEKLGFCLILIFLSSVILVESQIIKPNKNEYYIGDSVYILTTISSNDKLCRGSDSNITRLFIVEDKEDWIGDEDLIDVRGSFSEISNSRFPPKKIWENLIVGRYDLIIDCDENDLYDVTEPVYNLGFAVIAKKGTAQVSKGNYNKNNISWQYDPEDINMNSELLQLKLSVQGENVNLKNITIIVSNNNDLDLESVEVYWDKNNDGNLGNDDVKIGEYLSSGIIKNNQEISIDLDYVVSQATSENLLIVYRMKPEVSVGEYGIRVISIFGEGELSARLLKFAGLPIESSKIKILTKKECLGDMVLSILPNPAEIGDYLNAKVSNFSNCDGRKIILKSNFCYYPSSYDLGNCNIENGSCDLVFQLNKNSTVFSCLDKNNDGDFNDFGETEYQELKYVSKKIEANEKENITEANNSEVSPIVGKVIGKDVINNESDGYKEYLTGSGIFVLLEVTLLLILFVLIMILFKLRGPIPTDETKEEIKEDSDDLLEDKEERKEKSRRK